MSFTIITLPFLTGEASEGASLRGRLLWAPQGPQHVPSMSGRGWMLIMPPRLPPTLSAWCFFLCCRQGLASEAQSILLSTKDFLLGMKLSSPFGKVHSNSGSLQDRKETLYLYNIFHTVLYFQIYGCISL